MGLLLLVNRFVPLALALIAPILVGILTYHIATSPAWIVPGAVLSLLELYLAWSYRKAFCPMLAAKVAPGENAALKIRQRWIKSVLAPALTRLKFQRPMNWSRDCAEPAKHIRPLAEL